MTAGQPEPGAGDYRDLAKSLDDQVSRGRGGDDEFAARIAGLCDALEARVHLARTEEQGPLWARLGQTRLDLLGDAEGALAAFGRCLAVDASNAVTLGALERMLSSGDHRLAAASLLEPVYRQGPLPEGELRILETRAELHPDPRAGLVAFASAVDIATRIGDTPRALDLCGRALGQAFAFVSDAVGDWLGRLEQVASRAKRPQAQAAILGDLLGDGPIDSIERVAVAVSATRALLAAGESDRALALCRRALESDPSSPELLVRLDELLPEESPSARIARYEAALGQAAAPGRRSSLRHTIAAIRRDSLSDLPGAMDVWRAILSEDSSDTAAYDALIDATAKLGDADGALDLMDVARRSLQGGGRNRMTMRKVRALVDAGAIDRAANLCRDLLHEPALEPAILEAIAGFADEQDDRAIHRRALELLTASGDADARQRAHERLGDFLFDKIGDRAAAAESWKAAAEICAGSADRQSQARQLYERAASAQPQDRQAARQLVELYVRSGDWVKIPQALRVLMQDGEDLDGCVRLVLGLEESAVLSRALDPFLTVLDDLLGRLGHGAAEQILALRRARARVLATDATRQSDASHAYHLLIETSESAIDIREFEWFVESRPSAEERHEDRRWLFQWRSTHQGRPDDGTSPALPGRGRNVDVLIEWGKAEEEFGAPEAAMAVYQLLADTNEGRAVGLSALCRMRLESGDLAGGLTAFRALREDAGEDERLSLDLRMARLLLERGSPLEAAAVLTPTLAVRPEDGTSPALPGRGQNLDEGREILDQLLADRESRDEVLGRIEKIAAAADDAHAIRIFESLVAAQSTSAMPESRARWFERLIGLAPADRGTALAAVLRGAIERPDEDSLWDGAERIAKDLGRPEAVALAYHQALAGVAVDSPSLAEAVGRRMVRFEEEHAIESSQSIEALLRVLSLAPGARWALDRVKLELGSQARWDELFGLFDRAIDASADTPQRGELLHEAAVAAKDLAGLLERAIGYLEPLHALRPEDPAVEGALERLYERQGQKVELIELLGRRLEGASGFKRRDLRRRMASLWLDLGDAEQAGAVVEQMLEKDAFVADVVDLLERIVEQPPRASRRARRKNAGRDGTSAAPPGRGQNLGNVLAHDRAIERLRGHYESLGRIDDVVRIAERSLALADDAEQRGVCIRDLVRLRLRAAERGPRVFAQVLARVESDVAGVDRRLRKMAYRALLIHAIHALEQASAEGNEDRRSDAEDGAYRATQALRDAALDGGDGEAAFRALYRGSRLPFDRARRRELRREAALLCAERLQDPERAIRIFGDLYGEDAGDEAAAKSLGRFAQLLEAAGQRTTLAKLWEMQANVRAKAGNTAEERLCWERAAEVWEREEAWEQTAAAYRRGAALGSEASFEALARIQTERREWADAAQALEWLYAHAPAKLRGARALRLAEVYVELERRDRARACLEDALQRAAVATAPASAPRLREEARTPDDTHSMDQVRERLIALYRQDEVWRPLAHLLSVEAQRVDDVVRKLSLLREAADLYRWRLDEPGEAAAHLEVAVSLEPGDGALRASLVDVLEALQRWDQAAAVLRGQLELCGDHRSKERAWLHRRLARALVGANRSEDALAELRLAVEMHPAQPAILYDLARLALDLQQLELSEKTYRALLLALPRAIAEDAAPPPARIDIFLDLSEIAVRHGDAARASDLIDSAFDEALEHGEDPARLERGLRARGCHDLLAHALEHRVERGSALTERAVALGDLADLWTEHLGQSPALGARMRQQAERIARDLDHEDMTDAAAWVALTTVYSAFDRAAAGAADAPSASRDDEAGRRLLQILEAGIPKVERGPDRSRLRVILARALQNQPGQLDAAISVLSSATEEDPAGREATALLAEILDRQGRIDELLVLLERRLRSLPPDGDGSDFVHTAWRLAQTFERAGRANDALAVYESILDRRPAERAVVSALQERLEHLGSSRVADGLEQWMALDREAAPGIAQRLVELRASQGDRQGVLRALEAGFSADPAAPTFRERLLESYDGQGEWSLSARVLARALGAAPEDRPLLRRLIEACAKAGDDPEALRVLDTAVAAHPTDAELLSTRANLRERIADLEGAAADLERASQADPRQVNALFALLGRIADRADSPGANHAIRSVDTLIRLNRPKQARRELERLLARNPEHADGLGRLASLAAAEGDWEAAAEAYRKLLLVVERGTSEEELVRVAAATAEACWQTAGGLAEARAPLERVLDKVSRSQSPTRAQDLERLCRAMKDWGQLSNLLIARAEQVENAQERTALLLGAGQLLLEETGDPASALRVIEACRAANPESIDALLLWARAQVALGRVHDALFALYETAEQNRKRRSPLLANVYLEIGKAHLAVDEIVEGFDALELAFAVDWRTGDVATLLGLVALDLGAEKVAERAFSAVTTLPPRKEASGPGADAATRAVAFYHLASIASMKGDLAKARRLVTKAIGGDPGHAAARALLEKLNSQVATSEGPRK